MMLWARAQTLKCNTHERLASPFVKQLCVDESKLSFSPERKDVKVETAARSQLDLQAEK